MNPNVIERYDRQMKLWGQHGQAKCSSSKICLINADSLGLEILRGLCLAGIGSFTILDSHKFTNDDIGSSFIHQFDVGKSRGESSKAMLLDINEEALCELHSLESHLPHVSSYIQQSSDQNLLDDDSIQRQFFWRQFDCVIASGNLYMSQIDQLSRICWANNIPLIRCRSIGFYGYFKNQLKQYTVEDTHPEWRPRNWDPKKPDTVVISTKPIYEQSEYKLCNTDGEDIEDESITEYVCLKALDLFFSSYGRLPGYNDDQFETDVIKLKECVKRMIGKSSNQLKTLEQWLYELCRYGGAEMHITSAFMGGCIAQEAIKIITKQYIPVNDSLIYNAMTATTKTFKFNEIFSDS